MSNVIDFKPRELAAEPEAPPARDASLGRLLGIDAARALAVFGMYYAHVGPFPNETGTWKSFLMEIPHGRSSALFATLAGLSLVLLAGGSRPKTGRPMRQTVVRIAIRSVLLLALGSWLVSLGTSIVVILAYYGLFFLLALPFIKLRARTLAIIAVVVGIGGPVLIQWLWTVDTGWMDAFDAKDPLAMWSGEGLTALLFNGTYPGLAWMAYVFAGMAIGKLDLTRLAIQVRLLIIGPALALLGYGGAWLIGKALPSAGTAADSSVADASWKQFDQAMSKALEGTDSANWGKEEWKAFDAEHASIWELAPVDKTTGGGGGGFDWTSLVSASPHSNMPLELAGNIGVACTVIAGLVFLLGRFAKLRFWFAPLIAVGSMSLTAYVAHIAAVWYLVDHPANGVGYATGWRMWAVFVVTMLIFAPIWKRFLKRGPLEYPMYWATLPAKLVK
ncbi:heparan-alpha-glucosaminide N-acetyltransferase domain-containing protein [Glycomyces sp. NPDC021274]|uniref:heparan-alpha-glucosaminide N-acetyltransferase domain-containing protein n=1 Tax=Glycomyces sp. NPDC021274 TaxID=3155120 RepID=UPI0033D59005